MSTHTSTDKGAEDERSIEDAEGFEEMIAAVINYTKVADGGKMMRGAVANLVDFIDAWAARHAPAPVAGGLMRYSFDPTAVEEADPHGEWVKFSDVQALLASRTPAAGAVQQPVAVDERIEKWHQRASSERDRNVVLQAEIRILEAEIADLRAQLARKTEEADAWSERWLKDRQVVAAPAPGNIAQPAAMMQALTDGIPLQEPVNIGKALRAHRLARVVLGGGTGPVAAVHLVNIGLTGWIYTKDTAEAYAKGFNDALKYYRDALLEVAASPHALDDDKKGGDQK